MIISKIIGSFRFELSKEILEQAILNYFDYSQYQILSKEFSDCIIENKIIFVEKDLWIGDFLISTSEKEKSILSVRFSSKLGELNKDEDDFCITKLRDLSVYIIGKLQDNENIIPINREEGMNDLYRAFLYEEQQAVKNKKKQKKEKLLKEGIYSREFYSEVVRTRPEFIEKILNDYKSTHLCEPYWQQIEVIPSWISPAYNFILSLSGFFNFGYLAEIEVLPINDIECKIIIRNYSGLPYFSDPIAAKHIYFETIEELQKISLYFIELFSNKPEKKQMTLEEKFSDGGIKINKELKRKDPGARKIDGFDEAFFQTLNGSSENQAFDWWKSNYPDTYLKMQNSENSSSPLECFKAGMKYRKRKFRSN